VRRLEGGGNVTSIAFSPDVGRVAAGSDDRRLRWWDAERGTLLVTSEPENGDVHSVAFSPDGTKLLASIGGGAVQILDAATGGSAGALLGQARSTVSGFGPVSFTPDGTRVIKADGESLQIWNAASSSNGMILRHVSGEQEFVSALAVAPNHRYVAAGGRSLHLWDARSGAEITESGRESSIHALAFSPDSRLLAAGLISGRINIHDATTGMLLFRLDGHHDRVTKIIFNSDGSQLLSSSADRTVRRWRMDTHTGTMLVELADPVNSIALSPDEHRLATGSGDLSYLHPQRGPNIRIWDAATGRSLFDIDTKKTTRNDRAFKNSKQALELRGVSSIAFSPDGRSILSAENISPNVRSWDLSSGAPLRTFAVSGPAEYLPRGTRILSVAGGHLTVIDAESGERILFFREEFRPLSQIAVSADGSVLVEAVPYGAIRVRDATPTYEPEAAAYVRSLYSLRGFHEDVTGAIRADKTLTPPMRDASLRMSALLRDAFPEALNRKSMLAVRSPGNRPAAYRLAVTASETVCRVAPWNPVYFNTLGIALYRSELYENALGALTQARQMRGTATVSNLAFTAMAQYRLGRREEAAATLRALKLVISKSRDDVHTIEGNTDELGSLVAEAESVISPASSK
jgi:WD40 repeat protein